MTQATPAPTAALAGVRLLLLALVVWLTGCPNPSGGSRWPDDGFEDHTVPRITSPAHFEELAADNSAGTAVVKFVILGFGDDRREQTRYLDGRFYEFHDEWYWFRLFNGYEVPGTRHRPLSGQEFSSVAEAVDWARAKRGPLPFGMRMIDERLYSDYFYEISVRREQRVFGIGTLVHIPARSHPEPREELWAFELEYSDALDSGELERFFAALQRSVPAEIGQRLRFVARSPAQERLVARLRGRGQSPLAARVMTYAELAVEGEIEVYNPGLIAGRLRKLPRDRSKAAALLAEADEDAIWLMADVPDELPTAAGLLTAVPQTPLAHVNLLARNRGIPNAYLGGLLDDPQIDQLARVHAPVVLLAESDGTLVIEPISEAAYATWLGLSRPRIPTLTIVDPATLDYTLDLRRVEIDEVADLRPIIGGKAAGFPVLRAAGVPHPEAPLAITVRAYAEHVRELEATIRALLDEPVFDRDGRLRFLLLEGREDFEERFTSEADRRWLEQTLAEHPPRRAKRDPIAELLARDGIKRAIRDKDLDPRAAAAVDEALRAHFGHFAPSQGLRFRSSSTVEDVEGFSGAGLYDSNTGFLNPAAATRKKDKKRSVEWALKKTWASYWSWEAFEERRLTGIDHLAGNMAVLVHARFDDPLELANGVVTVTLDRSVTRRGSLQRPEPDRVRVEINAQLGALSVTNPPPDRAGEVLPEVIRVRSSPMRGQVVTRVGASTELPEGRSQVLDEVLVNELAVGAGAIAGRWLAMENQNLDEARRRGSVTLDLEFRVVDRGWPARADGSEQGPRLIFKQARSLDPGLPAGAERLLDQPIPRDLLLYADRIEQRSCQGPQTRVVLVELWTDPMAAVDLGHGVIPFLARVQLRAPSLADGEGPRQFDLDHREFVTVEHPELAAGAPWSLKLQLEPTVAPAVGVGMDELVFDHGLLRLAREGATINEEPAPCTPKLLLSSPRAYLRSLIPR